MKTIIFILTTSMLISCTNLTKRKEYRINGSIEKEFDGKYIMLFKFRGDTIFSVDTSIIKNGMFVFKGKETLCDIAILTTGNYPEKVKSTEIILERGDIDVIFDSVVIVTGTFLNDLYNLYKNNLKLYKDSIALQQNNELDKRIIRKDSPLDKIINRFEIYRLTFIRNNLSNPVGRRELKKNAGKIPYKTLAELYTLVPDQFKLDIELKRIYEERKRNEEVKEKQLQMVGKKYIDFELKTVDGKVKKISDYVGRSEYLFLEFTASWCAPCIADIPHLKEAYKKYNNNGLEVISISLDTNAEAWKELVKRVNTPWIQLSDLKGEPSELTEAYHIHGIPYGVLISKDGEILAVQLRGRYLNYIMPEILKKEKNNIK